MAYPVYPPSASAAPQRSRPWQRRPSVPFAQRGGGSASSQVGPRPRPPLAPTRTIPGFHPDYGTILKGDAGYQELLNNLGAEHGLSVEDRIAKIRRRLVEFGQVPGMNLDDIDPATRALIEQASSSGVSETARDDLAHERNLRSIRNSLAARGIYTGRNEGGYAAQSGRENERYTTGRFDQTRDVMDYLNGVLAAYASSEADRADRQQTGAREAWERGIALPGNAETADVTLNLVAGTSGYYKGSDGKLYNQQKQPIDVQAARARYSQMVAQAKREGRRPAPWVVKRLQALGG